MKTATVTNLRNNFGILSKRIRDGETVTITKRGIAFATLAPAVDRMARLRKMFQHGPAKGDVQSVVDYDRGNDSV